MFRILFILLIGVGAGYLLRHTRIEAFTQRGTRLTICALFFVFGVSIGADHEMLRNLTLFGRQASVIVLLSIAGSLLAGYAAQRLLFRKEVKR